MKGLRLWFAKGLAAALLVSAAVFGAAPARSATPFVQEHPGPFSGSTFGGVSLAVDPAGVSHVSFEIFPGDDLAYGRRMGGTWSFETVDSADDVGRYSSIALDSRGNPHISYYDQTNGDLKYARKIDGHWIVETVHSPGDVGQYSSLVLDDQDRPRIGFYDATNGNLLYASNNGSWVTIVVDFVGTVGRYCSLALDSFGDPRLSYYDDTNSDLKYASYNGLSWDILTLDSGGMVGTGTSLEFDAKNTPHIAYYSPSGTIVKYATMVDGAWVIETVEAVGFQAAGMSLAIDDSGNPCISYAAYQSTLASELKYAVRSGGWSTEAVDMALDDSVFPPSLAFDPQGNPEIFYSHGAHGVKYATSGVDLLYPLGGERWPAGSRQRVRWSGGGPVSIQISEDGGNTYSTLVSLVSSQEVEITVPGLTTDQARIRIFRSSPYSTSGSPGYFSIAPALTDPWWTTIVDGTGSVGQHASLALDAHDQPHLSYYDGTSKVLKYASRSGDEWTPQIVDVSGDVGLYSSLVVDDQGTPHISYFDNTNNRLLYITRNGGIWSGEVVDDLADLGYYTSIALDDLGNPHISYLDFTNLDLKYARKSGGLWITQIADGTGDVGYFTSLALDSRGNPHISYYDFANGDLKYASKLGVLWSTETVDTPGDVGWYTSLAVDSEDDPHISYVDGTNNRLKYVSRKQGNWKIEVVDDVAALYTSLKLDAQGDPRIGYQDDADNDLRFAGKVGGVWIRETVDATGSVGAFASLVLDSQGNPRLGYYDNTNFDLRYASAAVELIGPSPADVWPVGASRTVRWKGTGRVDVLLSVDGGNSFQLLAERVTGGEHGLIVPHQPSAFAQLRIQRAVPYSRSILPGLFTIETDILLLSLSTSLPPAETQGALISWETEPGPEDLAGYRLEKQVGGGSWSPLMTLTRETSYHDRSAVPGTDYRLFGVNGLGESLLLGETRFGTPRPLVAAPLPYRGGRMQITFTTSGGYGDQPGRAEVSLYDLQGRLVRTLARGLYPDGVHTATWDGRDRTGRTVSSGVYFLRSVSAGKSHTLKLVVAR